MSINIDLLTSFSSNKQSKNDKTEVNSEIEEKKEKLQERFNDIINTVNFEWNLDLSECVLTFDLKGTSAGQCRWIIKSKEIIEWVNFHGRTQKLTQNRISELVIRINTEAMVKNFDIVLNDTLPHEIAHALCAKYPYFGKNHDKGWKHVCIKLGGSGDRTHSLQLTKAKKTRSFLYVVDGREFTLKLTRHNRLQNKKVLYYIGSHSNKEFYIFSRHFVEEITE